tara:strand:+ start:173 stop:433 length:261 start_codon:yes stop_codon:yes gene_type:complete
MNAPKRTQNTVQDVIKEVQASDRALALNAITQGVKTAQARWIEAPLIAEALLMALVDVAQNSDISDRVAKNLRSIASALEQQNVKH